MSTQSWCKVASNLDSHPKIRKAGRLGREVFLFALRKNAEPGNPVPGMLPAAWLEDWYIADQLMMTVTESNAGVTAAVSAGLLVRDGESYVITGWDDDWGRLCMTNAERQSKYRASHGLVWKGDFKVTPDVTAPLPSVSRGEERRGEEKRLEESIVGASPPAEPSKAKRLKKQLPEGWAPKPGPRPAGFNETAELEAFRDHHTARANTMADWDAAWRTWMRNWSRFRARNGSQIAQDRSQPTPPVDRDLIKKQQLELAERARRAMDDRDEVIRLAQEARAKMEAPWSKE